MGRTQHCRVGLCMECAWQHLELKFKEKLGFMSEAEHVQQEPFSQQQLPADIFLLL